MKKFQSILTVVLAMMLVLPAAAFASWAVSNDALKAIEAEDTFGVRVISKSVTDGVYHDIADLYPANDLLTLVVENKGTAAVQSYEIYLMPIQGGQSGKLKGEAPEILAVGESEKYTMDFITMDDEVLQPGTQREVSLKVDHSLFSSLRCMVKCYTDTQGNKVENPLFEKWRDTAWEQN